jgi:hypothetical protein
LKYSHRIFLLGFQNLKYECKSRGDSIQKPPKLETSCKCCCAFESKLVSSPCAAAADDDDNDNDNNNNNIIY